MKPARADIRPAGQAAWRPSRQRASPSPLNTGNMMTTGSTRGKCSVPQAAQTRFQPPEACSEAWPQAAQKPWRRRQSNRLLAVAAMPASASGRTTAASRISMKRPSPPAGPLVGSIEPSNSAANTGAPFHRPRKTSRSRTRSRAWASASQTSRSPS
ncbi:hypothetical protein D3C80_720410 [compost metagenome]